MLFTNSCSSDWSHCTSFAGQSSSPGWSRCSAQSTCGRNAREQISCICKNLTVVVLKVFSLQEKLKSQISALCTQGHLPGVWGCAAARVAVLRCGGSWMSWQKGLFPFPTHTRSILSCPVRPAAGNHGATVPCGLSEKERSHWCGWGTEGAVEPFVCRVGFATTVGQVPRVVPGYLELSFLCGEKKKRNGALPQGKMISQTCAAVGSCILLVFTFIRR